MAGLYLLKEVADPIFDDADFQNWSIKVMGVSPEFFKYWEYIGLLDLTIANASSVVGIVVKNDWFDSFYTTWKTIQTNEKLNVKLSKEKVKEINNRIENVKEILDGNNIVY